VKAKDFKIRERLECTVNQNGREVHFLVRIQDLEPGRIRVDQPVVDQNILHLEVGTGLLIHFHRSDGSYEFDSYIIGKDQVNTPCLIIAEPQNVVRHQLREYFRVETSIDVTMDPVNPRNSKEVIQISAEIVNISAGGAKVKVKSADFNRYGRKGEQFRLNFNLPARVSLKGIFSEIVNLQKLPDNLCYFHLEFVDLDDAIRKEIVVFNFHRQRNQMKRWVGHQYYQR